MAKLTLRADFANIVDRPASCQTELSLLPMVQFWGLDKQESFSDRHSSVKNSCQSRVWERPRTWPKSSINGNRPSALTAVTAIREVKVKPPTHTEHERVTTLLANNNRSHPIPRRPRHERSSLVDSTRKNPSPDTANQTNNL